MAKPKKKKPAKKATKARKKPARKKAAPRAKCQVKVICGKRRKICHGFKTIRGKKRFVITSNKPA